MQRESMKSLLARWLFAVYSYFSYCYEVWQNR